MKKTKAVAIPEKTIEKYMKLLDLSREEAVQMYLEEEGYETNDTVEELTAKAKENKINHEARSDKPRKNAVRERKPDEEKERIIEILSKALENAGLEPKITNSSKNIEFFIGKNSYKVDLVKHRPPKK